MKYLYFQNWIENTLWPIKPIPFVATTVALAATLHYKYPENAILDLLPKFGSEVAEIAKTTAVAAIGSYAGVFTLRKLLKHFYFSYKGFLFDNPKKPCLKTKIWGVSYFVTPSEFIVQISDCPTHSLNFPTNPWILWSPSSESPGTSSQRHYFWIPWLHETYSIRTRVRDCRQASTWVSGKRGKEASEIHVDLLFVHRQLCHLVLAKVCISSWEIPTYD